MPLIIEMDLLDTILIQAGDRHKVKEVKPPVLVDKFTMDVITNRLSKLHEIKRDDCFVYVNRFIMFSLILVIWYILQKCRTSKRLSPMQKLAAEKVKRAEIEEMIRAIRASRHINQYRPYEFK